MTLEVLMSLLFWSFVVNAAVFTLWIMIFILARDWVYDIHNRWFDISEENFCSIHYLLMGIYKLFILIFNLIPYLILKFII